MCYMCVCINVCMYVSMYILFLHNTLNFQFFFVASKHLIRQNKLRTGKSASYVSRAFFSVCHNFLDGKRFIHLWE